MRKINILKRLLGGLIAVCLTCCTVDHFDVNNEIASQKTLWEQINSNPELSQFAYILSHVKVSKSETTFSGITYADLLKSDQAFTVFAPKNGTYNHANYDSIIAGNNIVELKRLEKNFIQNCLIRYSHMISGNKIDTLFFYNGKKTIINNTARTIDNSEIKTCNIGCSNGVLHITNIPVTYKYSIYEYISSRNDLDSIYKYLKTYEKDIFDEYSSIPGPPINGVISWIDSVNYKYNMYLLSIDACIDEEDSSYAVILPNNKAWDKMLKKTKNYFNYLPLYTQKITTVNDKTSIDNDVYEKMHQVKIDSLFNLYSKNAICQNLFFNMKRQSSKFNIEKPWRNIDDSKDRDSLLATSLISVKAPYIKPLFENAEKYTASNGTAYIVNEYKENFDTGFGREMTFETDRSSNVEYVANCQNYYTVSFIDPEGKKNSRSVLYTNIDTTNPEIKLILRNLMSCEYDIYVVMAYNDEKNCPYKFEAYIKYHDGKTMDGSPVEEQLYPDPSDSLHYASEELFQNHYKGVDFDNLFDTIQVAKNFNFPACYRGLTNAYAALTLKSHVTSTEKRNGKYCRDMMIDKIIVKAKERTDNE